MDRKRHRAYRAVRQAVATGTLDGHASAVIKDHAEALLLARDDTEARAARDRVLDAPAVLVDAGRLPAHAASRFWVQPKLCGPAMPWPPSWFRLPPAEDRGAVHES
jgi:hypothetical protein